MGDLVNTAQEAVAGYLTGQMVVNLAAVGVALVLIAAVFTARRWITWLVLR